MSAVVLSAIVLVCICAIGLLFCFRGYKWLRVCMVLYGFYAGYNLVMSLYGSMGGWMWILALGLGIVVALLAFLFVKVAIFLAGGGLGLVLYQLIALSNPVTFGGLGGGTDFLIGLIFFVVAGAITLAAKKPLIIIGTACYGAYTFTDALGILIGVLSAQALPASVPYLQITNALASMSIYRLMWPIVPWLIVAVLAIFGMIKQFRLAGKK